VRRHERKTAALQKHAQRFKRITELCTIVEPAEKRSSGKLSEMQSEVLPAFQSLPVYSAVCRHLDTQKPSTRIAWLLVYRLNRKELGTFPVHTILFALLTLHPYLG